MGSLGTVLDRLSGLLSKYFLIASYFPVLIFLSANAACLYTISPGFRRWFHFDSLEKGMGAAGILAGAGVVAFFLSTLGLALRQWLEDPRKLPAGIRNDFIAKQTRKRAEWNGELATVRRRLREYPRWKASWDAELREARAEGRRAAAPNRYEGSPAALQEVAESSLEGAPLTFERVDAAVRALAAELRVHNPEEQNPAVPGQKTESAARLDDDEVTLRGIIDQMPKQWQSEAARLYNEIQFNFAPYQIAPTRVGNIALSVASYFGSRYNLNFNFFWTRIQKVLETDKEHFQVLEGAKAQLDFHIALFWLSCLFGLVWIPTAAWTGFSIWFLAIVLVGPLAAATAFYELTVQSYRSYADLLRTTGDLFHFELMKALHLGLPVSSNDEREVWRSINEWLGQGDYRDVTYKHPAAS